MDSLHQTTRDEVAPVHSTVAIRLVLCALLALLAALIDLIAVVGRRGALAGVPLARRVHGRRGGATLSRCPGCGSASPPSAFLILLGLDAEDELHRWGRRIARRGGSRARLVAPFSAQRIGADRGGGRGRSCRSLLPVQSRNLITDLFRNGTSNGEGNGSGTGRHQPVRQAEGRARPETSRSTC